MVCGMDRLAGALSSGSALQDAGLTLQPSLQAACGARHTVFQTACSKAFSSGWGKYGQLGLGDTRSRNLPEQVAPELGDTVRDVACGWWSTMLLARE